MAASIFEKLVAEGRPTGEVVSVERYLVTVKGLDQVAIGALIVFESGQRGMVREVGPDLVGVLNLEAEDTPLGTLAVLKDNELTTGVGEGLIGRVVTPLLQPLDGKGAVKVSATWPVYHSAPGIMERSLLKDQLPTGVNVVDMLFPIVLGQRIAILGDTKTGKSSFLLQLGINQTNSDRVVVHVLIGKRKVDIDQTVGILTATGAIKNSILVVANIFDSLAQSYLAPYIGCAIAEYLWYSGRDVVIIYDDLSSHAKVYREISLLTRTNPGRDSYPGDMFFAHSSLLERAGKLVSNDKTLTALPVVIAPSDDITAYLPTSVMSITDGQLIFDLETFRQNIRPAINTGLSVSRVGGRAQSTRQKQLSAAIFKAMAAYRQASEFSHFSAEISAESRQSLALGKMINETFRQSPSELYSLLEQQIMLATVVASEGKSQLNIDELKKQTRAQAMSVKTEADIDKLVPILLQATTIGVTQ